MVVVVVVNVVAVMVMVMVVVVVLVVVVVVAVVVVVVVVEGMYGNFVSKEAAVLSILGLFLRVFSFQTYVCFDHPLLQKVSCCNSLLHTDISSKVL